MSVTPPAEKCTSPTAGSGGIGDTDPFSTSVLTERFFRSRLRMSQLRLLVAVADFGKFKYVAEQFSVAPSTISKQVTEIEEALGRPLLKRIGNRLEFTEVGALLALRAREVLDHLERTRLEIDQVCAGEHGSFGVGAAPSIAALFLPELVLSLKRQSPNALFQFCEGKFDVLAPLLENASLDIVLVREPPHGLSQNFIEEEILADPDVVVCNRQHPLAARDALAWKDLSGMPWILPIRGSRVRQRFEAMARRHGLTIPPGCVESISLMVNVELMQAYPSYVAMLSRACARKLMQSYPITILPLSVDGAEGCIKAMWHRDNADPLLHRMVEVIRRHARNL